MKRLSKTVLLSFIFAFAAVLTVFSERATQYATEGLRLCALCIVPSLFPYMVIANMMISGGAADFIGRLLPVSRLYGLPRAASAPILLGAVCGFPVGAKSACDMYKTGIISKTEAEALIGAANNTGPSFVVSVIGATFFKSPLFGWLLYGAQLLSSFVASIIVNRFIFPIKEQKGKSEAICESKINFFQAVSDSVSGVLTVCGFIVFFTVISGFSLPYISSLSPTAAGVFSSILEFTTGSRLAAEMGGCVGRFLCGLAVGWAGISVFCQTLAFTSPLGLSPKRLLATKALQGILTGIAVAFVNIKTVPNILENPYKEASLILSSPIPIALISLCLYVFLIKNITSNHKM